MYGVLDKNIAHDPNINIEILTNAIIDAKNMHIPIKRRKFNKRKDKKEVWMTDQLLELVNRKNDLYIELKKTPKLSNCYNTKKVNFKGTDHVGTFMGLKCVVYYANYRSGNQSSKIQVVP